MNDPERYEEFKRKSAEQTRRYKQKIKNDPVRLQQYRDKAAEKMKRYRLKRAMEQKIKAALPKLVANKSKIEKPKPKVAATLNRALEKVEQVFEAALPKDKARRDYIKQMFLEKCLAEVTTEIEKDKKKVKKKTKKFVETECAVNPQKDQQPLEQDELEIKEEEEYIYYENVDDAYCRCCFKIFTSPSKRNEISQQFLVAVRETFHMAMTFKQGGSKWICSKCLDTVMQFKSFRKEITAKQAQFSILLNKGEYEDLMQIQKISENFVEEENLKLRPLRPTPAVIKRIRPMRQQTNQDHSIGQQISEDNSIGQEEFIIKEEPDSIFVAELEQIQESENQINIKEIFNPEGSSDIHVLPKISYIRKRCKDCQRFFQDLLGHRIKQHGHKQIFSCSACDFKADTRPKVTDHIRIKHVNYKEKKTCEICGKLVRFLDDHILNVHRRVKNFLCDLCDFSAYGRDQFRFHFLNCHLPKNVKCPKCEFTTINNERLKNHTKNMHGEQVPIESELNTNYMGYWQCPYEECKKILKKKPNLDTHIKRVHQGENKFKCDDPNCTKLFYARNEMLRHYLRIHGKYSG